MGHGDREGLGVANGRGVGAVHDKDGWLGAAGIYARIHEREGLTLRVWQSFPHEHVAGLADLRLRSRVGDDYLRLGYLKAFMDGTLGSQTAWLLDGSAWHHGRRGAGRVIRAGARAGGRWPCTRSATAPTARRSTPSPRRATNGSRSGSAQRIEHAQRLAPEDVGRFAEIGVACSVQFSHAPSDRDLAERFWPDGTEFAYAYRSLLDSGAVVANGSDAPVEELDPLAGIAAGVLRTIDERPGWHPEQAVTVEQALHASTVAPAWLAGDEHRRGKLLPASSPTWSCSIATRSQSSRRNCPISRSSRPWSVAGGSATRLRGTSPAALARSGTTPEWALQSAREHPHDASRARDGDVLRRGYRRDRRRQVDRADRPRPVGGAAPVRSSSTPAPGSARAHSRNACAGSSRRGSSSVAPIPSLRPGSSTSSRRRASRCFRSSARCAASARVARLRRASRAGRVELGSVRRRLAGRRPHRQTRTSSTTVAAAAAMSCALAHSRTEW